MLRRVAAVAVVPLVAGGAVSVTANAAAGSDAKPAPLTKASAAASFTDGNYVVVTKDQGATTFKGTRAAPGKGFDAKRSEVSSYRQTLRAKQGSIAKSVGAKVERSYSLAVSGFSARLTRAQAQKLATNKDVLLVQKDEAMQVDTWQTPKFLGLDGGKKSVWSQLGGPNEAGDGVVVGVIDTGAWPENPSFAGAPITSTPQGKWGLKRANGLTVMKKADGDVFTAPCQTGEEWTVDDCNSKLISARYYPDTYLANVPEANRPDSEYISPRDGGGHGSHTASTAAGNNGVPMSVEGIDFGKGSGMAPGAKIAVYKTCFDDGDPDTGDCYTSGSVAAIEDSIEDGVDVLNYSISGSQTTVIDAVELAFEGAAEAGIFVAVSAGNSGPTSSTVAHNSPWLTTVASTTHFNFENTVVLGNGQKYKGASIARAALPSSPLVNSTAAGLPGADATALNLCGPDVLDPAKTAGKIVVCTRGTYDRVAKSAEVKRAGGVGMVLANATPNSLDADFHSVPTVHVDEVAGAAIKAYAATAGATASFQLGDTTGGTPTPLPQVSSFSSRGPALANGSDLLKPDISAPGSSVLAAVAPPSNSGRDFDLYSGTSMAAPHIAGLAALYLGEHPNWSPMAVKSAMMTTSVDAKTSTGGKEGDNFAQGAGFVQPKAFFDPGLVVDSGAADFRGFITGQGLDTGVPAISATDFNGPSVASGAVTGSLTTKRTFTATQKGTWTVKADIPGFKVTAKPAKVTFTKVGQAKTVEMTFTRTSAPVDQWAQGHVFLTGPKFVRLPVSLKPVALAAPAEVTGDVAAGSVGYTVTGGEDAAVTMTTQGLNESQAKTGTITTGDQVQVPVTVAAGTTFSRFDLDTVDNVDLDLFLYRVVGGQASLVAQSATSSGDERIDLPNLAAGQYIALVDGYDTAGATVDYRMDAYNVNPATAVGSFTVSPNPANLVQGASATVTASWTGLDASKRYLGWVGYSISNQKTIVTVK
ncbi:peptidase inhibitor I9 [Terracoccus luteus]|uniref:Peptidase inhibitor I9 n=1 Tax=Terracoccus luteus TaxID=53356 RepID=A0A495Y1U8_9MICO|nr:S8 family peptidase [Terracoccus luteus]RKT79184.1 peptidase inhibitor I9 [Terracoccus luteus]